MKRLFFIVAGAALLGWWWWSKRSTAGTAQQPSGSNLTPANDSTAPVINLTPYIPPATASNATNPTGTLAAAQQQQQQQAAKAANNWLWLGGSDPGKVVSLNEFNSWLGANGNSKCAGGDCAALGRPCLAGYDCAPGQPGWKG